jgi:inner membrane protein
MNGMKRVKDLTRGGGFKVFLLAILVLLFLIPASMVRNIIYERSFRAAEAETEILEAWGGAFAAEGPVLRIPCKAPEEIKTRDEKGKETTEVRDVSFSLWITPEQLDTEILLKTETKKRGIFSVPLFAGTVQLSGHFNPEKIARELPEGAAAFPEEAELVIALSGQRGIRGVERAAWNGGSISFLPGNRGFSRGNGDAGIYGKAPAADRRIPFDIILSVQGGKSLGMVPLGEESSFSVKADWPAPSFQGAYLPAANKTGEDGFEARWNISHLSRAIPLAWTDYNGGSFESGSTRFWVHFFKALDHYDLNTRAVKYAILFIIIPFLSLFLFEVFLHRTIHPVQYILSGAANVVFYLLLLSFSEHLPFAPAYWIAALAVTVMMILYSRSLLGSWVKSRLMGLILIISYGFLYFTLQSEDWALLIGSLGIFGVTGTVMFVTRKLDWNRSQDETADTL